MAFNQGVRFILSLFALCSSFGFADSSQLMAKCNSLPNVDSALEVQLFMDEYGMGDLVIKVGNLVTVQHHGNLTLSGNVMSFSGHEWELSIENTGGNLTKKGTETGWHETLTCVRF